MNAPGEAEDRAQFMLRMRARGIRDLNLLRALEKAPRALFMPQRYADISSRDIVLPIGCGQAAAPPSVVAAMIQALGLDKSQRVLEVGTGTGYAASLLSQLAREVVSIERCQTLALEAATRIQSLGLDNVRIGWANALDGAREFGVFDRIIVHAVIDDVPALLAQALGGDGALVAARVVDHEDGRAPRIVRLALGGSRDGFASDHGPARSLTRLSEGLSRGL
jgi:protein-L-isoaspartate(D-aspartate) O-methyltransferase